MANHHNREAIEAIGSQQAASANAAANVQIPQRQVQAPAPVTPHRPVEMEHAHGPATLRRGDWLNLTPMAAQKVAESAVVRPPREAQLQEAAKDSPHGEDLARIAKGEETAEEFQERRQKERDDK